MRSGNQSLIFGGSSDVRLDQLGIQLDVLVFFLTFQFGIQAESLLNIVQPDILLESKIWMSTPFDLVLLSMFDSLGRMFEHPDNHPEH